MDYKLVSNKGRISYLQTTYVKVIRSFIFLVSDCFCENTCNCPTYEYYKCKGSLSIPEIRNYCHALECCLILQVKNIIIFFNS